MKPQLKYHDRGNLVTQTELFAYSGENENQDQAVLDMFTRYRFMEFTPLQMEDHLKAIGVYYAIGSIRRAINHLAEDGKIICNGSMMERFKRPNKKYRLK